MKDWLDILKQFGFQVAPWMIVVVLILYVLRERLSKALNALLDWLGTIFRGEWSYRRFENVFRPSIRAMHLYMRVVGIRSEKGREPTIPEAYVPLRLAPYFVDDSENTNRANEKYTGAKTPVGHSEVQHQSELWSIDDLIQRHGTLVILGDPGAGKSTLLKYLITRFTQPRQRQSAQSMPPYNLLALKRLQGRKQIIPCPLYVSLRSCQKKNDTLLEDILDPETKILASMIPSDLRKKMPPTFIERCIRKGRAILLLDGLDEVTDEEMYADVVRKINDFYLSYPENRVVVTCRIAGWRSGLHPDFTLYRALPLDRQQQHDFIARWYQTAHKLNEGGEVSALLEEERKARLKSPDHHELRASEEADALEHLLRERERLAELAANPMLLSLICLVYHLQRDLPRGRATLYDECVQILLGVWDSIDKGLKITKPTMDEKRKILRHVAYIMHINGQKDISRQNFVSLVMSDLNISEEEARLVVRQIEVRSWLIAERVIDHFAFSHLTLQEFFVVEYFHIEKHDAIDLAEIKDWNIWREPVLLMCGKSADPTTFIERIAIYNATLALLCITEADSTLLDIQRMRYLLEHTLDRVRNNELTLIELIPALVNLLAIEKSPFANQVMNFVEVYFRRLNREARLQLMTTIGGTATREAARLLLYLHPTLPDEGLNILKELVLIGSVAVEEALQWNRRGDLNNAKLEELLLQSYVPEATQALWERNGLEPEVKTEAMPQSWAESWACRLTLPENARIMRSIPYNGPIDPNIWPYRKSQRTALAAIGQKCVQILSRVYKEKAYGNNEQQKEEFLVCIERITQFDLHVQIPLFILLFKNIEKVDAPHEKRIGKSLFSKSQYPFSSVKYAINEDAWYSLIALSGMKASSNIWKRVGGLMSGFGLIAGCVLLWTGVMTLLWHSPPAWLLIVAIVILAIASIFSIWLTLDILEIANLPESLTDGIGGVITVSLWILFTNFSIPTWFYDSGKEIKRFLAIRKMNFWYPIAILIACIVNGVFGGFAVQSWFHLTLPLSMLVVGFGCLLCSILFVWTRAFSKSSEILIWLEQHPNGLAVLDEFRP